MWWLARIIGQPLSLVRVRNAKYEDQIRKIELELDQLLAQEEELTEDIAEKQAQTAQQQTQLQDSRRVLNDMARAFQKADLTLEQARPAQHMAEK